MVESVSPEGLESGGEYPTMHGQQHRMRSSRECWRPSTFQRDRSPASVYSNEIACLHARSFGMLRVWLRTAGLLARILRQAASSSGRQPGLAAFDECTACAAFVHSCATCKSLRQRDFWPSRRFGRRFGPKPCRKVVALASFWAKKRRKNAPLVALIAGRHSVPGIATSRGAQKP
jgi:hypothetical protein